MDAQLERERAEVQAREAALALKPRRVRKGTGTTVVLSIRLDIDEMRSLEGRAALLDMKPTVLARNLIRTGLRQRGDAGLITAVEQLTALVDEIRGLVG